MLDIKFLRRIKSIRRKKNVCVCLPMSETLQMLDMKNCFQTNQEMHWPIHFVPWRKIHHSAGRKIKMNDFCFHEFRIKML